MSQAGHDHLFKMVIIGDTSTGKSCILRYFTERKFKKSANHTVGVEFGSKVLTVGGKQVKLQVWDTAGQERFRSVTRAYYRGALGCLLVYDVTSRDSFNHISAWLNDVRELGWAGIQIVLVGNKSDLTTMREVTLLEASRFAQENNLLFMETSAVTGECIDEVFLKCTSGILQRIESGTIQLATNTNAASITADQAVATGCRC